MKKVCVTLMVVAAIALSLYGCKNKKEEPESTKKIVLNSASGNKVSNPFEFIQGTSADQKQELEESVASLRHIDAGYLYSMNYTADDLLDSLLEIGVQDQDSMKNYLYSRTLKPGAPRPSLFDPTSCSAFHCFTPEGDHLFCRNYDYGYLHPGILIRMQARNGRYASIGLADARFASNDYKDGVLHNGNTDISYLSTLPYNRMDGMNEYGVAAGLLQLVGGLTEETQQTSKLAEGKTATIVSAIFWAALDKCKSVDEVLDWVKDYAFFDNTQLMPLHLMVADPNKAVIIEFVDNELRVIDDEPVVENFYTTPSVPLPIDWKGNSYTHPRYNILKQAMTEKNGVMTEEEALNTLYKARYSQESFNSDMPGYSHVNLTAWAVVYNMTKKTAKFVMRENPSVVYEYSFDAMLND